MKLIDLLVKELPKRGGWPDGVSEIGQDYDGELMFYGRGNARTRLYLPLSSDHRDWFCHNGDRVTKDRYESALAASKKPAWNGEGLPPVGCECEYISNGTSWGKVKVIGFDDEKIVIRPSGEIYYSITQSNKDVFIPLRTEADKKRDSALDAIYGAIASAKREHNLSDEADEVYKAIAAGKIPGVKLDD